MLLSHGQSIRMIVFTVWSTLIKALQRALIYIFFIFMLVPVTSFILGSTGTAPEKAPGWCSLGDVGVRGVMIHQSLQMALRSTEAHGDIVRPCPVAASGPTSDVILQDFMPEHKTLIFILPPSQKQKLLETKIIHNPFGTLTPYKELLRLRRRPLWGVPSSVSAL